MDCGAAQLVEWKRECTAENDREGNDVGVDRRLPSGKSSIEKLPQNLILVPAMDAINEIRELDASVYGIDRGEVLSSWAQTTPEVGWALIADKSEVDPDESASGVDHRRAVGFVLGRPTYPTGGLFLGPLIAEDEQCATMLLDKALSSITEDVKLVQMLLIKSVHSTTFDGGVGHLSTSPESRSESLEVAERAGFVRCGDSARIMTFGSSLNWVQAMAEVACIEGDRNGIQVRSICRSRPFAAAGYEYG